MRATLPGAAAVLFCALRLPCASFGQQGGDPSAQLQQVQQMCSDPKTKSLPMMANICSQMSNMPAMPKDGGNLTPPAQNTMQGGGPGFAQPGQTPGAGASGAQGGMMDPKAREAFCSDPNHAAEPICSQQGDAGGSAQQGYGIQQGMSYGGGPGQSHVQSIKTGFRQMTAPTDLRKRMKQQAAPKPPTKAELAAQEAKKKAEEEAQRKELERLKAEAKAKAEAGAAARKAAEEAAARAAAAPPPAPLPPPPVYENLVPTEFMVEASLLKEVDGSKEYFGPRRLTDVVIMPLPAGSSLRNGVVWEVPPGFRFALCPLDHDPFNFGLPKRVGMRKGLWDRLVDGVTGLFGKGKKRAGPGLVPYLAFESGAVDKRMDLLGAGGIVPMSMYWSGPEGASAGPAVSASAEAGVPAATGLGSPEGGYDADELARQWGLMP
ncbi:MAG: hypothetical protein HY748_13045 [Elusimicrobia bacterium]|nr:hypothetical protein [Elusimicrobiota bacterium]